MEVGSILKEVVGRFTKVNNVSPGKTFRVGWETSGFATCEVGARRLKAKDLNGVHVNLKGLPSDSEEPLLYIQIAKNGWVNLDNRGRRPLTLRLPYTNETNFRFVLSMSDVPFEGVHKKPENGVLQLQAGEAISTEQGGASYVASWQNGDREATLTLKNKLNYSTNQPGVDVTYSLK